MNTKQTALIAAAVLAAGGISLAATAAAAQDDSTEVGEVEDADDRNEGPDVPITGDDLDRASAVALDFTGEGRVTGTEVGDEESYYEVEVTLDDGRETDIQLDEGFNVVGTDD